MIACCIRQYPQILFKSIITAKLQNVHGLWRSIKQRWQLSGKAITTWWKGHEFDSCWVQCLFYTYPHSNKSLNRLLIILKENRQSFYQNWPSFRCLEQPSLLKLSSLKILVLSHNKKSSWKIGYLNFEFRISEI